MWAIKWAITYRSMVGMKGNVGVESRGRSKQSRGSSGSAQQTQWEEEAKAAWATQGNCNALPMPNVPVTPMEVTSHHRGVCAPPVI